MKILYGYTEITNNLIERYQSNKLHNSIILYGPKGIGKKLFLDNLINKFFEISFKNRNISHHQNLFFNKTHPNIKILEKEYDIKTKNLNLI